MCPKEALFGGYIQLELDVRIFRHHDFVRDAKYSVLQQLREFDRVRTIYEKYIEWDPTNSSAWIKFAELESQLEDFSRTRGIFELGISQPSLSMPELLWKAYIDFETEEGERERARSLYERLVKLSGHVKVWISYALFEGEAMPVPRAEREEDDDEEEKEAKMVEGDPELARQVFKKGYEDLRGKGLKSEVFQLLAVYVPTQTHIRTLLSGSRSSKSGEPSKKSMERRQTSPRCKKCSPSSPSSVCMTPKRTRMSRIGSWCSRTTRENRTRRVSSSCRWLTRGRQRARRGYLSSAAWVVRRMKRVIRRMGRARTRTPQREKGRGNPGMVMKVAMLPVHMGGMTVMLEGAALSTC